MIDVTIYLRGLLKNNTPTSLFLGITKKRQRINSMDTLNLRNG